MLRSFFIHRPVFAAVVSIVIVLLGAVALVQLPVDRYPEIAPPTIAVTAMYPGATADTIAEVVATPIEQEVNGVEGMIYMTSNSSSDGTMQLKVTFETGVDLDMANVLVQNRVALAEPKLPEEVRRLGVTVKKRSSQIIQLINLYSPDDSFDAYFMNNYAKVRVRDELTRIDGVGDVQVFGEGYAMRIWLDIQKMRVRDLTTNDVIAAIREQNVEIAAGQIGEPPIPEGSAFQLVVNAQGRLNEPGQFENIVIRVGPDGRFIRLKDIAEVELGAQSYMLTTRFNRRPTATMAIFQMPGSNAIAVADSVTTRMNELSKGFPEGLAYDIPFDTTKVIRSSLREVVVTLFITLAIVVLTVYLFLQNFRATVIPSVTIPVSLIGTFVVMAALGYTLNVLTLFGLVLVIGIVVDDAIVVVENTSRLIDRGIPRREAAVQSMREVTGPVIATTLVLLAVFVPTIFMSGITGKLFQQFAVTISIATVFSSINALTLSPALCGLLLVPSPARPPLPFRAFNWVLNKSTGLYTGTVRRVLRRAAPAAVVFAGLVALGGWAFARLPTGFVPQEDEGYLLVNIQLPDAASIERTQQVIDRVERLLIGADESPGIAGISDIVSITGYNAIDESRSSNNGAIYVVLEDWDDRPSREQHMMAILRRVHTGVAQIEDAAIAVFPPPSLPGVGASAGISMQLQDRGNVGFDTLQRAANELVHTGEQQPALTRVFTTFRANVPQLFLDIDRDQVKSMEIPLQNVFDTLATALGSAYINDFTYFGRIYQVKAQAAPEFRTEPDDIRRLEVRNSQGGMTPLGTLLNVEETLGPQTVTHFNIYPAARISGSLAAGYSSGQAMQAAATVAERTLPGGIGFAWTDLSYQEAATAGTAGMTFAFSILLVYLVLAAQYESWSIPMAIVLGVPIALLGGVLGAYVIGFAGNVYMQIGIVLLIGLSAKTAILIVEFAKVQHESGKSVFDAAVDASELRFRAVLMTALSFILGVIPLLVATGAGAMSRRVLGITVFGGMGVGTLAGLVATPMLFFIIQRISNAMKPRPRTDVAPRNPAAGRP